MSIYGEYLFLENFATGVLILIFTGKILGAKLNVFPIILCGICCGVYAFVLFLSISGFFSWMCKLAFSLLMIWMAFGVKDRKKLLYGAAVFLGVTIFYGGIAIAFITSFSRTGVTAAAGVYMPPLTYAAVTAAAVCAALFLWFLLDILKTRRMEVRRDIEMEFILGSYRWKTKGFIDSGNALTDPLSGKPVCLVNRSLGQKILEEAKEEIFTNVRYRAIPYRAVGTSRGILDGYRMDAVTFSDGYVIKNPVIALCEEEHFYESEREMHVLLPSCMLERGIYGDI